MEPRLWLVFAAAECGIDERCEGGVVARCVPILDPGLTHRPLVVFLHGMVGPDGAAGAEETESRVRERFADEGFDVWAPHGRVGLCDWSADAKLASCWPSDERTLDQAQDIAQGWGAAVRGKRPTFIVGFSNGAAFSVLLATHGLVHTCGVVALHGAPAGALHIEAKAPSPMLFVAASDVSWEAGQIDATTRVLDAHGWRSRTMTRAGGHDVADEDLEATIEFVRYAIRVGCGD